jgi:hypothetical protein
MNRDDVAKTWLFRGMSDMYFAFDSHEVAFKNNARFSEIMGLKKFLKAVLLYQQHADYEALPLEEARTKIKKLAKKYGHKYEFMLTELVNSGLGDIDLIKRSSYDGYNGKALVEVVEKGYMETRYPVPALVSDLFPIGITGFTREPLLSSGLTKFIYALCNACFFRLSQAVDLSDVQRHFRERFEHRESFARFNSAFWEARCRQ